MKNKLVALWVLLSFLFSICIISCGDDEDDNPTYDEIVQIGKEYLMENKGAAAAEAFGEARKLDVEGTDANFGLVLAHVMQLVNLADMLVDMFSSLLLTQGPEPESQMAPAAPQFKADPIGDYIQEFLGDTLVRDFAESDAIFEQMAAGDDFVFDIEYYDIIFSGEAILAFGGQFDKTDLYLFGAVASAMNAVVDIVMSHDINFDFENLTIPTMDFTNDPIGAILGIVDLLEGLLTDPNYPNFLYLKDDGTATMQDAGVSLGNLFDRFAGTFEQLARETDDQGDDQFKYYDTNKNNHYDSALDPVQIATLITIDPDLAMVLKGLGENLRFVFWEGSVKDPNPYSIDKLNLAMFNDLMIYLGVLQRPILPDWLGVNLGEFFADPSPDGIRSMLFTLIELANMLVVQLESAQGA